MMLSDLNVYQRNDSENDSLNLTKKISRKKRFSKLLFKINLKKQL